MIKQTTCLFAGLGALVSATTGHGQGQVPPSHIDDFSGRPRVVVISDIGNEPDDQMSLVRFLIYLNEFDVEALIAATSTWQKNVVHPETMQAVIHAYGEVRGDITAVGKSLDSPLSETHRTVCSLLDRCRAS